MNAFKMSVQTNNQISSVDADEFKRQNESTNANVKDDMCRLADDSDQAKCTTEESDSSSSTKQTKLSETETYPENYSDTFTIPVFEQDESEIIKKSLCFNLEQTRDEGTLCETKNDLLSTLELSSFESSNITLQKAISEASLVNRNMIKQTDLPWVTLQYILKHNLRWRDSVLPALQLQSINISVEQPEAENTQFMTIGNILSTERVSDTASQSVIHPLDIFVGTFSCCSHELKVIICQKLLMCKQAIPLIYRMSGRDRPCFTALPLYSLAMECRTSENEADVIDAASAETKIIGFLRVGSVSQSKSSLLNGVLNADKHAPFCHHDSLLSQTQSLSIDGLVEATWFLPSGKKTDLFKEVITFLNLRGDAQTVKPELAAVLFMCSTIVALVNVSDLTNKAITDVLDQIRQSTNTVVLGLIENSDRFAYHKLKENFQSLPETIKSLPLLMNFDQNGKIKSTATWQRELRTFLASVSKDDIKKRLIKCGRDMCEQGLVVVDESENSNCAKGQMMARHLYLKLCGQDAKQDHTMQIEELPFAPMRDACLSLQGQVWKDLSNLTKKQYKAGDSYDDKDRIKCQLENTRRQQLEICKQLKPAFVTFLEYLRLSSKDDELCQSFILWLKIFLDSNSRRSLPGMFRKLRTDVMEVRRTQEKKRDDESIQEDRKNIKLTALKLDYASFGLEHLIRELGQLYECVMVFKQKCGYKTLNGIKMIPELVAKLLLKGEALEILDGDTANVPLHWIQSVFRCLKEDLGNRKLFVVSTLGLQSSGKSTLLNTMFGLQFKVSAGRCTKGVYAHLVCLENQKDIPYDYMLVIDTEGLRGQGREINNHDNELATFVIGMGDITLVNVKGENTTELKDVMQIAVHAFLRMTLTNRSLKIKRKCIFIHQNVGDVHAKEKLTQSLKIFLNDLDHMTEIAAKEENIQDVTRFNQIVDFQLQKHVLYFPDLWSGDPPMAPCNPGYSERVCEALEILHDTAKEMGSFITVTDFVKRIENLWKGIMSEDFVFCFQNSLEIKVYNSMEIEYHKHVGCFSNALMEWAEKASYELEECSTTDALTGRHRELQQELNEFVTDKGKETENQLIDYFKNSDMRETLGQWKNERISKFNEKARELHTNLEKRIFQKVEGKKIEMFQMDHKRFIFDKAKELAADMQGKQPTDEEIENAFDRVWPCWIDNLCKCLPTDNEHIQTTVYSCLYERHKKDKVHLKSKEIRERLSTPLDCTDLQSSWSTADFDITDIQVKRISNLFLWHGKIKDLKLTQQVLKQTSILFGDLDVCFAKLLDKGIQFEKHHAIQVIDKVLEFFRNVDTALQFTFLPPYQIKVAVHVCRYAVSQFTQMNETYQKKHSERAKIERYKKMAKSYFTNTVKREIAEVVAADLFCNCLKSSAIKSIKLSLPRKITHAIVSLFGNRKQTLLLTLMEYLAQQKQYDLYSGYLNDPFTFAYSWIKIYANRSIFKNAQDENCSMYIKFISEGLMPMILRIKEGIEEATKHVTDDADANKTIKDWLHFFQKHTYPFLKFPPETFDQVADQNVVEIQNFKKNTLDKLIGLQQDITEEFKEYEFDTFCGEDEVDYASIFTTLWGCKEQCPFCGEPCYRSDGHLKDGIKHSCIQHRPIGVNGTVYSKKHRRLIIESCNFQVQAAAAEFMCMACSSKCHVCSKSFPESSKVHRFKGYQECFPAWEIAPCTTMDTSKYWMWFMKTFKTEMAKEHDSPEPNIPKSWRSITFDDAMKSLRDY